MRNSTTLFAATAAFLLLTVGCATAPKTENGKANLQDDAQVTLKKFQRQDAGLRDLMDRSAGYAVFPSVGKGGLGVGGAYGKGMLYENGQPTGFCDLSQASIGFQAGGEDYSELIVFKEADALRRFKQGDYGFTAEASAVAIKPGASAQVEFKKGVAVFTATNAGLMYEASLAGQKFRYTPEQ